MIFPTVGRVVWFFKYVEGQGHKGPLAGHVCYVHSESCVNLMVIDEIAIARRELKVTLVQANQEAPAGDYCTWMPYQIGQAAKTEELQKQLEQTPIV